MSTRVVHIEKVLPSVAAAEKMCGSDEATMAQAYVRLVYCMAAWTEVSGHAIEAFRARKCISRRHFRGYLERISRPSTTLATPTDRPLVHRLTLSATRQ